MNFSWNSIKLLIPMGLIVVLFTSQYASMLALSVPLLLIFNIQGFINLRFRREALFLISLMLFLAIFGMFDSKHGLTSIFYIFSTVVCIVAAKHTTEKYSLIEIYQALRLLFWIFTTFIFLVLYRYWGHPEPFGELLPHSSTNGLPAFLILIQVSYSIVSYILYKNVSILAALIVFCVAFFGNGRGSLVVGLGIVIFSIFINMFMNSKPRSLERRWFILVCNVLVVLILVLLGLTVWNNDLLSLWADLLRYTKLSVGLVDTNRLDILQAYLENLSATGVFFGGNYSGTIIETLYGGNPHISFIRSHYLFGLIPMLCYFLSPLLILLLVKDKKMRIVIFGFVMLIWLRAITEPLLFPTILDFYYLLLFFLSHRYGAINNNKIKAESWSIK